MKKILFACDLDNTLIHSHKHRKDGEKCVELYEGREQSFMSGKAICLLKSLMKDEHVCFLPVTTRSVKQFSRIEFPYTPACALVSNGGTLLVKGAEDRDWKDGMKSAAEPYMPQLLDFYGKYDGDSRFTAARIVDELFLFFGFNTPDEAAEFKRIAEKEIPLPVEITGRKLYIFPPCLTKGNAVKKYAELINADYIISAGDSAIDISMLSASDIAMIPDNALKDSIAAKDIRVCEEEDFAEFVLRNVLEAVQTDI